MKKILITLILSVNIVVSYACIGTTTRTATISTNITATNDHDSGYVTLVCRPEITTITTTYNSDGTQDTSTNTNSSSFGETIIKIAGAMTTDGIISVSYPLTLYASFIGHLNDSYYYTTNLNYPVSVYMNGNLLFQRPVVVSNRIVTTNSVSYTTELVIEYPLAHFGQNTITSSHAQSNSGGIFNGSNFGYLMIDCYHIFNSLNLEYDCVTYKLTSNINYQEFYTNTIKGFPLVLINDTNNARPYYE